MPAYKCSCGSQRTSSQAEVYCPLCYERMERVPEAPLLPFTLSDEVPDYLRGIASMMNHNHGVRVVG